MCYWQWPVLKKRDWQLFLQFSLKEVLTGRQETNTDMMFHIPPWLVKSSLSTMSQSHRSYAWQLCFDEAHHIHPEWFIRRKASTSKETKWSRAYITGYISLICMVVHWWFCYVLYLCQLHHSSRKTCICCMRLILYHTLLGGYICKVSAHVVYWKWGSKPAHNAWDYDICA